MVKEEEEIKKEKKNENNNSKEKNSLSDSHNRASFNWVKAQIKWKSSQNYLLNFGSNSSMLSSAFYRSPGHMFGNYLWAKLSDLALE